MRTLLLLECVIALIFAGCATEQPPLPRTVGQPMAAIGMPSGGTVAQPGKPGTVPSSPPAISKPRATGTPEDARNHMLRGMAAIEMAKSPGDLEVAEDEFRMATEIAPQMAVAWFNLGKAQTQVGHYAAAIESYRQYLTLAPGAKDAQTVRDEIVKLEFRQELIAKAQGRAGTWVGGDGTFYELAVAGNRLTLTTDSRLVPKDEVRSTYSLVGTVPITNPAHAEYQLSLQGNHLSGIWNRGPVTADKCTVPQDTSEATGELDDTEHKMVLHHDRTSYEASTQMSLLGDDSCGGVVAGKRQTVEDVLYGPLGKGGIEASLVGFSSWWDGGFSMIHYGWQGRLGVGKVKKGTPLYDAGVRDDDEILAIDGVAVKGLSAGQAAMRLYGPPGSRVTLELWRSGAKQSFVVSVQRVAY